VRILREAALALHAAHRVGIVHRDVKPENIMLEGAERSVVVMDFGIAKSAGSDTQGLTGTGVLIGTPYYMSPEQATGQPMLDARSDQYALATVGYRLLTGRTPFEGEPVQTVLLKTVAEVPADAHAIQPEIPRGLSDALAKALAKRPEDRFESMAAFAEALAPFANVQVAHAMASRERKQPDLATRVAAARAAMPRSKWWLPLTVVAFAVGLVGVNVWNPRTPIAVASSRDDAMFAARTFLSSRGITGNRDNFLEFVTNDSVYRFLRRSLGRSGVDQRASADVPVWEWKLTSLSGSAHSRWTVWHGLGNRVTGFDEWVSDSAKGAQLSVEQARPIALAEIAKQGWDPSRLNPLTDSTIVRQGRVDHVFRWTPNVGAIPLAGWDSARVRLRVVVAGEHAVAFRHSLNLPDGYSEARVRSWSQLLVVVLFLVAIISAVGVAVRRQPHDELQWSTMIRLGCFGAGLVLATTVPTLYRDVLTYRAIGTDFADAWVMKLFMGIFMVAIATCFGAAAESLAYQARPGITDGLRDVARLNLTIPELVPAAVYGYTFGALLTVSNAAAIFVSARLGVGRSLEFDLPFNDTPIVGLLAGTVIAIAVCFALLFVIGVVRTARPFIKYIVAVSAVVYLLVVMSSSGIAQTMMLTGGAAILLYVLWEHGVLSAIIAFVVAYALDRSATLFQADAPRYLVDAIAAFAIAAAPGVVAFGLTRRLARQTTR
jgi:serine/threonine-protein kinase